jgi:hypothetical protein
MRFLIFTSASSREPSSISCSCFSASASSVRSCAMRVLKRLFEREEAADPSAAQQRRKACSALAAPHQREQRRGRRRAAGHGGHAAGPRQPQHHFGSTCTPSRTAWPRRWRGCTKPPS